MLPGFIRDGLASQTSTAYTLLYWHYCTTRMDVLIGHVGGGVKQTTECLCGNGAYLMYGNTSAGVGVGGVLLSGTFYMCPTVECILCSENVYAAHCMKQ